MARVPRPEIDRIKNEVSLQRLVEASGIVLKRHRSKRSRGPLPRFITTGRLRSSSRRARTNGTAWGPAMKAVMSSSA